MYSVQAIGVIEVNFHVHAIVEFLVPGIHFLSPRARDYQIAHQLQLHLVLALLCLSGGRASSWLGHHEGRLVHSVPQQLIPMAPRTRSSSQMVSIFSNVLGVTGMCSL